MDSEPHRERSVVALLEEIERQRAALVEARLQGSTRDVEADAARLARLERELVAMVGGHRRRGRPSRPS